MQTCDIDQFKVNLNIYTNTIIIINNKNIWYIPNYSYIAA